MFEITEDQKKLLTILGLGLTLVPIVFTIVSGIINLIDNVERING